MKSYLKLKRHPKRLLCIAFLLACAPPAPDLSARAQGCTQCRDNTAATPPATQRAYRHAITLLALSGGTIFAGTVFLLRKSAVG